MTNSNHAGLQKLNEASRYREKCENREKKVKRWRNLCAVFFGFSIVMLILSSLFMEPPLTTRITMLGISDILPVVENLALAVAIVSLVLLVYAVMKSINVETQANKARNIEGFMAQHLFRVIVLKAKRN